jgi:hypothetical protein
VHLFSDIPNADSYAVTVFSRFRTVYERFIHRLLTVFRRFYRFLKTVGRRKTAETRRHGEGKK